MKSYSNSPIGLWPTFQDKKGMEDWNLRHYLRHQMYAQVLASKGINIATPDIMGDWDADTFYEHWLLHSQVDQALGTGLINTVATIDVQQWQAEPDYADWQTNNAFLHSAIEQALGIV